MHTQANSRFSWGNALLHLFFILLSLCFLLPFLLVVSIAFTDENALNAHGYQFIPSKFSAYAFQVLFKVPETILHAYGVTILVTAVGTVLGLLLTALTSYSISRKDYMFRGATTLYVFFTMLFSGGLVPFYILVSHYLHMKDTIWAMILPAMLSPFYIMIMKGFLEQLPTEINESAKIDGAGEWRIFMAIVMPLSVPALTTIGLFIAFGYWNDWWLPLLFIDDAKLFSLQQLMYKIMNTITFLSSNPQMLQSGINLKQFPSLSVRMAMVIVSAGPMMIIFPFFQRYFVSGITVGSLKG
ncbi:carbohydrate ABC transporter permease [Paenibacillus lycopersici]|uniref:Carbohydrate ABC transporter permease n=1 Tax=Paenibacillus lycopersici TaxID=2704462 RepID=A0A6C0G4E0_9BACL|nr:carbohydrate ABC transporter permease [Paenibacillus lycopersici]QHT62334.1 carbohydrate ABC transporter permease [Paenibacillus lycopersici]